MSTDDASCSDCKMEIIERKWTRLLLHWINRCANPKPRYRQLEPKAMLEIMNKYKEDICEDELDKALIISEDLETFIKYKYPILRLRYLSEAKDYPKKLLMMASILIYHACASSQTGAVDADICQKLAKWEQEWLLKFCENLSEMETTISNVENAIRDSYEFVTTVLEQNSKEMIEKTDKTNADQVPLIETGQSPKHPAPTLKFRSSITVLPSVTTDSSSYSSDFDYKGDCGDVTDDITIFNLTNVHNEHNKETTVIKEPLVFKDEGTVKTDAYVVQSESMMVRNEGVVKQEPVFQNVVEMQQNSSEMRRNCQPGCACVRCSASGPCCGDPGSSMDQCREPEPCPKRKRVRYLEMAGAPIKQDKEGVDFKFNLKIYCLVFLGIMSAFLVILAITYPFTKSNATFARRKLDANAKRFVDEVKMQDPPSTHWLCEKNFCQKVYQPIPSSIYFTSLSRCTLLCSGPQLWPIPIGYTYYSKKLVALATNKMEYKFQSVPSENVHQYLAEAFKLFLGDLVRLERLDLSPRNRNTDLTLKKMSIQIDVETDPDPRIRLNTEESYNLKIETFTNQVVIKISSASFCGVRHGLETLSQMILLDQSTGYLITLSNVLVKDAPSYKYRGLMIDTARNYVPVSDLLRTIDAMATVKLNTFHWRITDVTSFPLYLPEFPQLFEHGAYDRSLLYTQDHIKLIVRRAYVRGIRVVIEVAAPGPVGRAWSWSQDVNCAKKNDNLTCDNILCLRLKMRDSIFDILQSIYTFIIDLTKVDDVFHLSNGVFSLSNCYLLIEDREGFLDKSLERLKIANKGFLPKLPIIWYTPYLSRGFESRTWDRLGVQLSEWVQNPTDDYLSRFRVVHSSRWDLSCEVKKQRCTKYRTWQEMYAWKSWRNIDVFTIEGGEAMLWTDLVDSGNLDYHLWPRVAAVAERLWSDIAANATANGYTYARLDAHRWRMVLRGIRVQPIWPVYCSFNPEACIHKIK